MRLDSILLTVVTGGVPAAASEPIVTLRPPEELTLKRGEARDAALEITIRDGFHIQANPAANEFLIPLTIGVEPTEALSAGGPRYPRPSRYRLEGSNDELLVYGGVIKVPVPIRASRSTPPGLHTLQGEVKYQACDDRSCRPPATADFELEIRVSPERAAK